MLFSFALLLLCGFALGGILQKIKLPALLGMIITGIVLGPYVLNLISPSILDLSADLRQAALIVILIRAGLALQLQDQKTVGRPAILMCFIPATAEIFAVTIFAPLLFGISYLEAAILGAVLAAVSPAIVVPKMLKLMESGYGVKQGIPQLIMAGASVDDVFVIVLFTSLMAMYQGEGFALAGLLQVPLSIILGLVLGILSGMILTWLFRKLHMRDTIKVLMLLALSFLFVNLQSAIQDVVPFSGLLAVMALGGTINQQHGGLATRLSAKYEKVWVGAELLLFVLVGAAVDMRTLANVGPAAVAMIGIAIAFRMAGVMLCLVKTKLNRKERLFTAISYLPKATVQAAIGGIPLALGVTAGNTILTVAVVAILVTAPIGAIGTDRTYKKLLTRNNMVNESL